MGRYFVAEGFEGGAALAFFAGQEAVEGEAFGWEAAGDEGAEGGVGAGDGVDGDACRYGFSGEVAPGSAMPGMPASETTAMRPPDLRASMSSLAREFSLWVW